MRLRGNMVRNRNFMYISNDKLIEVTPFNVDKFMSVQGMWTDILTLFTSASSNLHTFLSCLCIFVILSLSLHSIELRPLQSNLAII